MSNQVIVVGSFNIVMVDKTERGRKLGEAWIVFCRSG